MAHDHTRNYREEVEQQRRNRTVAEIIQVHDDNNAAKVHCFRFYKDGHVTYNQMIFGMIFYKKWIRVSMNFGYSEYLSRAKWKRYS